MIGEILLLDKKKLYFLLLIFDDVVTTIYIKYVITDLIKINENNNWGVSK